MRLLLALALVLIPSAALAHTGHGDAHGFLHGFMHPVGGLDHLLAMVAVGIFAYVLGGKALYLVPLRSLKPVGSPSGSTATLPP